MTIHVGVPGRFAGTVELDEGATVEELLALVAPESRPSSMTVTVNRKPVGPAHVLRSRDRVRIESSEAFASE